MAANRSRQAFIRMLLDQGRKGMRWCLYQSLGIITPDSIRYVKTYEQAERFCEHNVGYKAGTLSDVLLRLRRQAQKKKPVLEGISKIELCSRYPGLSFLSVLDHVDTIPRDIYFPVVWYQLINPVTDVLHWLVARNDDVNSILFTDKNYTKALDHFLKQTEDAISLGSRGTYRLQASVAGGNAERRIEIYRFYYHPRRACYILDKMLDGSKPFLLPVIHFARYSSRLQRLEFFNDALKKTPPGKIVREMDMRYFDFVDE